MTIHKLHSLLEEFVVDLSHENEIQIDLPDLSNETMITQAFNDLGYTDTKRLFRGAKLKFSTGTKLWSGKKVVYTKNEDIFEDVDASFQLPKNTIFVDPSNSKLKVLDSSVSIYKKLKIFLTFRTLLADLSDYAIPHEGLAKGSAKVILLIKTDDGGSKHDIDTSMDFESFMDVFDNVELDKSINLLDKLIQCIKLDDQQDKERKNCMRSAFDSVISSLDDDCDIFQYGLKNIVKLHKKYTEHHNIFLSDFTINKVVQEIQTKDLEYTGKINEITSSVQTKALAIPGAMVAISAVMKVDTIISGVSIVIALFATCLVIHKSLKIYSTSFNHLEKQIKNVFSRYQVLNQKSEIRKEAEETEIALTRMTQTADKDISFIRIIIWSIWLFSIVFVLFKLDIINVTNSSEKQLVTVIKDEEKEAGTDAIPALVGKNKVSIDKKAP